MPKIPTKLDRLFGTGGDSGCGHLPFVSNNEPLCSSCFGAIGSTLWVVGLVLYLSIMEPLQNWQAVSLDNTFRAVEPGCRFTNVTYVNNATTRRRCTPYGRHSERCEVELHGCQQTMSYVVEYPAEYGAVVQRSLSNTRLGVSPWKSLKSPPLATVGATLTYYTDWYSSIGKKQCIYSSSFPVFDSQPDTGPTCCAAPDPGLCADIVINLQCTTRRKPCTLKVDDNVCQLYPPPAWSTHLRSCWSGKGAKGLIASLFPQCQDDESGCMLLEDPSKPLAMMIGQYQKLSTDGLILMVVGGVLHLAMLVLSYCYCWREYGGYGRQGFWPEAFAGTFGTLACCLCFLKGVGTVNERCRPKEESSIFVFKEESMNICSRCSAPRRWKRTPGTSHMKEVSHECAFLSAVAVSTKEVAVVVQMKETGEGGEESVSQQPVIPYMSSFQKRVDEERMAGGKRRSF